MRRYCFLLTGISIFAAKLFKAFFKQKTSDFVFGHHFVSVLFGEGGAGGCLILFVFIFLSSSACGSSDK